MRCQRSTSSSIVVFCSPAWTPKTVMPESSPMSGPLEGVKVVEIAGIGPGPFCAMLLADLGADVIRVDRAQNVADQVPDHPHGDLMNRGRRSVSVDLKNPDG